MAHIWAGTNDKARMGAFLADAENIFETACQASREESPDCDWAILIGPDGQIRMMQTDGWSLPSLATEHGARTAYRISRRGGQVELEGRRGNQICVLRSESPAATANALLGRPIVPTGITAWSSPRQLLLAGEALAIEKGTWKILA